MVTRMKENRDKRYGKESSLSIPTPSFFLSVPVIRPPTTVATPSTPRRERNPLAKTSFQKFYEYLLNPKIYSLTLHFRTSLKVLFGKAKDRLAKCTVSLLARHCRLSVEKRVQQPDSS
uniref:Uncharacterized protein n=1 Tax=Vespula pensylvanica TaxID=30213 RepID=A0A834UEC3_VESPE|nr:hypothetical protein H0235_003050 [Vespula pensylvanica]